MLGKIEGGRRRGWQRMRRLDGITDSMDVKVKVAQSCLTLCDPMNCIVHGIFQARILDWVAFPFPRGIKSSDLANTHLTTQLEWDTQHSLILCSKIRNHHPRIGTLPPETTHEALKRGQESPDTHKSSRNQASMWPVLWWCVSSPHFCLRNILLLLKCLVANGCKLKNRLFCFSAQFTIYCLP